MKMGDLASKFLSASAKVDPVLEKKVATLAEVGVGFMKREIQAVRAVDTGAMLNSTVSERVTQGQYLIGPTMDYSVYVALGTSRMPARPFHISAAKRLQQAAPKVMNLSASDLGL